jgi:hypothetical protein
VQRSKGGTAPKREYSVELAALPPNRNYATYLVAIHKLPRVGGGISVATSTLFTVAAEIILGKK